MSPDSFDAALPSYVLLARFVATAPSAEAAVQQVEARRHAAEAPFDEARVERDEGDGSWMVVARFVEASVDEHTAATGLYETLTAAGLGPDEVWVDSAVAD